jgi:hypothetical protein
LPPGLNARYGACEALREPGPKASAAAGKHAKAKKKTAGQDNAVESRADTPRTQ